MKRLLLSSLLLQAAVAGALAEQRISVVTVDGEMASVRFDGNTRLYFTDDTMEVAYDEGMLSIPLERVVTFEIFEGRDYLLQVENLPSGETPELFRLDGKTLHILPEGAVTGVTRLDGSPLMKPSAVESVDLSLYSPGIFIVTINGHSFKFRGS